MRFQEKQQHFAERNSTLTDLKASGYENNVDHFPYKDNSE